MFSWFRTAEAEAFGKELAGFMVAQLQGNLDDLGAKNRKHAEKAMAQAARKVDDFRARHRLNFYSKAKLANTFLWSLKEAGWPTPYADQMTEWLTLRL